MKIHYLQHVPFEGIASIGSWAIDNHHTLSATRFYAGDSVPSINTIDWLVVMGGPMNIYEDEQYPWLIQEKRFIEQAIERKKIVIGICLGSQLIADVLGAKVYQGEYKEIGWFPIYKTSEAKVSPIFTPLPQQLTVFHWHGDTFDMPSGATHLAYSEGCQNQAFIYEDRVLGLQFHLEVMKESVRQIIENCSDELNGGKYIQSSQEMLIEDECFYTSNTVMTNILNLLASQYNPGLES